MSERWSSHLFKSNQSNIERARPAVSLPLSAADDIARTAHSNGDSVNDVKMFTILRYIARDRSGRDSSVRRSSFRWMKTSQPLRRKVRTFAMYSTNVATCLDSRHATAERARFMRREMYATQHSAMTHRQQPTAPHLPGPSPLIKNHTLMARISRKEPHMRWKFAAPSLTLS